MLVEHRSAMRHGRVGDGHGMSEPGGLVITVLLNTFPWWLSGPVFDLIIIRSARYRYLNPVFPWFAILGAPYHTELPSLLPK